MISPLYDSWLGLSGEEIFRSFGLQRNQKPLQRAYLKRLSARSSFRSRWVIASTRELPELAPVLDLDQVLRMVAEAS
jgi:hypothetical protein